MVKCLLRGVFAEELLKHSEKTYVWHQQVFGSFAGVPKASARRAEDF
jgi:hypothetical protein